MSHIQNTHNSFPMNHHNLFMFSPLEPAGNWVTISHCWSNVMMNSSSFPGPDTHCTLGKLGGVGQPHNRTVFVHFTFLRHFNLWCCWTNYELLNVITFHMFKLQFFGSQKLDCVVQTTTSKPSLSVTTRHHTMTLLGRPPLVHFPIVHCRPPLVELIITCHQLTCCQ